MSGRQRDSEIGFGSDSFLDIIANIVGILIILIVMTGLKVSQAPVSRDDLPQPESEPALVPETPSSSEPVAVIEAITPPSPDPEPVTEPMPTLLTPDAFRVVENVDRGSSEQRTFFSTPTKTITITQPKPERVVIPRDGKLEAEIASLREQIASLQTQQAADQQSVTSDESKSKQLAVQLAELAEKESIEAVETQKRRAALLSLTEQAKKSEVERARLRRQLDLLESNPTPSKSLTHRITPVSKTVVGNEIHFLIDDGKISVVPIKNLQEMLGRDVMRNRSWLLKSDRHQGVVGPVGGYLMHYVVRRVQLTTTQQLAGSSGSVRVSLSKWVIQPGPDVPTEPFVEAVQDGSRFHATLAATPRDTSLTFWVYPDSFDAYRQVQEFAQAIGFRVAARPLPEGVPITGSPSGSRSAAQ